MKRIGWTSLALVAVLSTGCGGDSRRKDAGTSTAASGNASPGGNAGSVGTSGRDSVRDGDRDLVRDVAQLNAAEIELGRFGVTKAADPGVKQFAQMMIDDHTNAGSSLRGTASQYGIETPAQPDDKDRDLRENLARKQGLDFDRAYMDAMVDGHQKLVDKLESRIDKQKLSEYKTSMADRISGSKNKADVKAEAVVAEKSDRPGTSAINQWAAATYPIAYAHLQSAKTLADTLKKKSTH